MLDGAALGGRAAQEALYRSFERPVFTLLLRVTGCRDTAADLMQDTFLQAFERLPQFRGESPFGRWLRAIAVSLALMHLRKRRRFVDFLPLEALDVPAPSIEDLAQHDLEHLLGALPPMPRAVLWLHYVEMFNPTYPDKSTTLRS